MEGDGVHLSTCSRPGSQKVLPTFPPNPHPRLGKQQFLPPRCSGPEPWSHGGPLSFPRSSPSANPVDSTFKIHPESNYPPALLLVSLSWPFPDPVLNQVTRTSRPNSLPVPLEPVLTAARGMLQVLDSVPPPLGALWGLPPHLHSEQRPPMRPRPQVPQLSV